MGDFQKLLDNYNKVQENAGVPMQTLPENLQATAFDQADQQQSQFRQTMNEALDFDPDKYAQAQKLGTQMDVAPDVVARNQEYAAKTQKQRDLDYAQLLSQSPFLARQLQDPEFARISHDEIEKLTAVETVVRSFTDSYKDLTEGYKAGQIEHQMGLGGYSAKAAETPEQEQEGLANFMALMKDSRSLKGSGDNGFIYNASKIVGGMTDQLVDAATYGAATGMTAGGATALAGQLGPQVVTPEEIITVPVAAIAGFSAGFMTSMGEDSYYLEAGSQYAKMKLEGFDESVAQHAGTAVGVVNAGLEMVGFGLVAKPLKDRLIKETTKQISEKLVKPTFAKATANFGKAYAVAWGGEVGTELIQEVVSLAGEELGKNFNSEEMDYKLSTEEGRAEVANQFLQMFEEVGKGMAVLALPASSFKYYGDIQDVKKSKNEQALFKSIHEMAADSKVRERNPDQFAKFITDQMADTGSENIYIDAQVFNQLATEAGITPEQLSMQFPEAAEQINEANRVGEGDIVVKHGDYAARVAGTPFAETLMPHLRATSESLSASELQSVKELRGGAQEQIAAVEAEAQVETDFDKSAKAVQSTILGEIQENSNYSRPVAQAYAGLVRDFYTTAAKASGLTPEQVYQRYQYKVQSAQPKTDIGKVYNQSAKKQLQFSTNMDALLEAAKDATKSKFNAKIGSVEDWQVNAAAQSNIDLKGFTHTIDVSAIRHSQKNHGNVKTEANRGQVALTDADFKAVPSVVQSPDQVVFNVKGTRGQEQFFSIKRIDPDTTLVVSEVRKGRKSLAVQSMRKYKGAKSAEQLLEDITGNKNASAGLGKSATGKDVDTRGPASHALETSPSPPPNVRNASGYPTNTDAPIIVNVGELSSDGNVFNQNITNSDNIEDSAGFNAWAGEGHLVVEGGDINDTDFGQDGPYILKVHHGTTHEFEVFDADLTGNKEGQFGAVNYFTSSEFDAEQNYTSDGTDLTNRIEQGAERKVDEIQDLYDETESDADEATAVQAVKDEYGEQYYDEDTMQMARNIIREELAGQDDVVMDVFVKTEKPFVIGDGAELIDLVDYYAARAEAIEQVADDNGRTFSEIEADEDAYADQIQDYEYDILDRQREDFNEAIATVAQRYDVEVSDILEGIESVTLEGFQPSDFESALRGNEALSYAEDPDTGGLVGFHMIGEIIQELGYDSIILKDANERFSSMEMEAETAHVHVFNANNTNVKSVDNNGAFNPVDPNIYRQETRGGFDPERLTTILNEKADYSTFLHETGHFFLEVHADMATQGLSNQASEDMNQLLDWFGVDSLESWNALSMEQKRPYHEQFAYNFEVYLFEGKAPTLQMQSVFDRFSAWLRRVYTSIRDELNVAYRKENGTDLPILTGEIAQVMDRMLASEKEIAQAEQVRGIKPIFNKQKDSGMNDAQWSQYQAMANEYKNTARSELAKESVKQVRWLSNARSKVIKQMQAQTRNIRAKVREQVRIELETEPRYAAETYFRKGKLTQLDGSVLENENTKLDLEEVKSITKMLGVDHKQFGFGKGGMLSSKGVNPNPLANVFGYDNAEAMIRDFAQTRSLAAEIEFRTDDAMLERHGELVDENSVDQAVDRAIHNEARAKFVAVELKHLTRATQPVRAMVQAAKETAREMLSTKIIDDVKPNHYSAIEARAARKVLAHMQRGQSEKAVSAKHSELLNNQLAKESHAIIEEVDKMVNRFKQIGGKSAQGKMRGDALEQLNALLGRFDLRTSVPKSQRTADRRPLAAWVDAETERLQAAMPDLPDFVLNESFQQSYKELNISELRDLNDAVTQLQTLAKREFTQYTEVRNQTFEMERESVLEEIRAANPKSFDQFGQVIPWRKDFKGVGSRKFEWMKSAFDGEFINYESLLGVLTGGEGRNIYESLFGRLSKAADTRNEFIKRVGAPLQEAMKKYTFAEKKFMQGTLGGVKELSTGRKLTHEEIIAVALFNGSKDGRQRLTDGNQYSLIEINEVIASLSETDVGVLNAFWDMNETLIWPELRDLNRRTLGKAPAKVEVAAYMTPHGPVKGGYVPLVYDGELSNRAQDYNNDAAITELRGGSVHQAQTSRSASKGRVDTVERALDLSLRAIFSKINETSHDITHREAVADTYRLLQDRQISEAIKNSIGPQAYQAMQRHVRTVAAKPHIPSGFGERVIFWARKNTLIALMGASVKTAAVNVLGLLPTVRAVGLRNFTKHAMPFLNPVSEKRNAELHNWVLEKSQYMRNRASSFDRDMNAELQTMLGKQGMMPTMAFWFGFLAGVDKAITIPTWMAAYEDGMHKYHNDNISATEYADRVVRESQGSGRTIDLAQIASNRGESWKAMTMFYNYFSAQLGRMRKGQAGAAHKWRNGEKHAAAQMLTLDLALLVVLPAVIESLINEDCGEDPSAEEYVKCLSGSTARYVGSFFPIVRDIVPSLVSEKHKKFGVRVSPISGAFETMAGMPDAFANWASGEATETDAKKLIRGVGYMFGLPSYQAWRTIDGYQAWQDGDEDIRALLFGVKYRP